MLKQKRFLSMLIDFHIIIYVSLVFWDIFCMAVTLIFGISINDLICLAFKFMLLVMIKDLVFRNASIGKKLLKLEILKDDGTMPHVFELLFRNILFIIFPAEIMLALCNDKRIGDMIFKTSVVLKN